MKKSEIDLDQLFPCPPPDLIELTDQLLAIRQDVLEKGVNFSNLDNVHPHYQKSARNMIQYLAFRMHDVRQLQVKLSDIGLSSMSRAERKVQATIDTVLTHLHSLSGKLWKPKEKPLFCYQEGRRFLEENTIALLGEPTPGRRVRIMVTLPSEAADNYNLVKDLLLSGMNCARINCAHDNPEIWERMVTNIRHAEETTAKKCRVLMDLCGPKLRTGDLVPGPAVYRLRPKRDSLGKVLKPAHVWFFREGSLANTESSADVCLPVSGSWLKHCSEKCIITLIDARGAKRKLKVSKVTPEGSLATSLKTIYLTPGLELQIKKNKGKGKKKVRLSNNGIFQKPSAITLEINDSLLLTKDRQPGRNAYRDEEGVSHPAVIGCSIPEIIDDVEVGEPIWFDDGSIGGIVEQKASGQVHVRITYARSGGSSLKSEKGINLPNSKLSIQALSNSDLHALPFIVEHADLIGLSFANTPKDVEDLIAQIKKCGNSMPGLILKIETPRGFDNLPAMILKAMEIPLCGVMIARGDLAIECGFGRLVEVQEEILWVCESAHVPVIWATQVLEGLAKKGMPSRAEVTDAAMGERAECIMLNKGEHIVMATRTLSEILSRMQDHQTKKRSLLRKLGLAEKFFAARN